ncbi:MAG: hypothetical protein H0W76_20540 [Pyrinomonadaceae bacterium]|nr:hypothetical protein [Pyrinomonadaceae bacterium]
MNLTRLLLITLFVLSGTAFINAQENKCTLKIEQAPELRGFRLGMTWDQVKAYVPGVEVSFRSEFDFYQETTISNLKLKGIGETVASGVSLINLVFVDNKLIHIRVDYSDPIEWKSADEFSAKVSNALRLPNAWQSGTEGNEQQLECDGFQVKTSPNQIGLSVSGALENMRRRMNQEREKRKEERRKAFKP